MIDKSEFEERIAEVENMELSAPSVQASPEPGLERMGADPWQGLRESRENFKAAVDASSIVSFVDGLSGEQKSDVLDGVQFAERAANAQFDRATEIENWYGFYADVLSKLGWVTSGLAFDRKSKTDGHFKMSEEALAVISAIATGNQLAVLKSAIGALSGMADDSRQITLFDFNVSLEIGGNFQIGAAESNGNDSISMAMGAFYYRSNDQKKNILFFSWGSHDVDMWTSAQQMTLDSTFYAPLRKTVRDRLGTSSEDFIADIPII